MRCAEVRPCLPLLVSGDLGPTQATEVKEHLRTCTACRSEQASLGQLRPLLDAVPVPAVRIDLPRLYREAAERQQRRLRRWRRAAAVSLAAAAAAVLFALGLALEVRVEAHQVVVRWGTLPPVPDAAPAPLPDVPPRVVEGPVRETGPAWPAAETEEQLRLLTELTQLLASDLERRDGRQRTEIARLQVRLMALERQMVQWRLATDKDVAAVDAGSFIPHGKGTSP